MTDVSAEKAAPVRSTRKLFILTVKINKYRISSARNVQFNLENNNQRLGTVCLLSKPNNIFQGCFNPGDMLA